MKYSRYSRWQPFILFTSQIFLKYKELFILFFHSAVFVTSQESMTIIVQAVYERTDEWAKQSSLETQIFIKTVLKGQDWELKVQNHCSSTPCNNCPDSQASSRWAVLEEWRNALAELCCSPTAAGRTKLGNVKIPEISQWVFNWCPMDFLVIHWIWSLFALEIFVLLSCIFSGESYIHF